MRAPLQRTFADRLSRLPGSHALWSAVYLLTGKRLARPLHVADLGRFGAIFEVDLALLQERLGSAFRAVERRPGVGQVHVAAVDYRDLTLLGPYRELWVFTPVVCRIGKRRGEQGIFTLDLPVSTRESRWFGKSHYGLPEWRADIGLSQRHGAWVARVVDGDQVVLELVVSEPEVLPMTTRERFRSFSVRADELIESTLEIDGTIAMLDFRGGATLRLGLHPAARALADLRISRISVSHYQAPHQTAHLSVPVVVGHFEAEEIPEVGKELAA